MRLKSSQVKSSQVKSSQVKSSQVKSSQVKFSIALKTLLSSLFLVCFSPTFAALTDDFSILNKDNWYVTRVNYNWSYSGLDYAAVSINNGSLRMYNDITDNGPVVFGQPINLGQGNLSITRKLFIHPQNDHFDGSLDIYESDNSFSSSVGKHLCSVYYARETYGTSRIGFFLSGNNLLSSPLSPTWDSWFNEEFKYDAKTGLATYTVNGQTINVSTLNIRATL